MNIVEPGSADAQQLGRTCPHPTAGYHGPNGTHLWFVNEGCPVHDDGRIATTRTHDAKPTPSLADDDRVTVNREQAQQHTAVTPDRHRELIVAVTAARAGIERHLFTAARALLLDVHRHILARTRP